MSYIRYIRNKNYFKITIVLENKLMYYLRIFSTSSWYYVNEIFFIYFVNFILKLDIVSSKYELK